MEDGTISSFVFKIMVRRKYLNFMAVTHRKKEYFTTKIVENSIVLLNLQKPLNFRKHLNF
jgi:hypothetical protein